MKHRYLLSTLIVLTGALVIGALPAMAQEVWTGYAHSFEKEDYADWNLEDNQDRITPNVWLTRKNNQGLFNIAQEDGYQGNGSPADTEWAFGHAEDWEDLTFECWACITDWEPPELVGEDAVVHLISEDIYIDIRFESWTEDDDGGGFSYVRAAQPVATENGTWSQVKSLYR